MTELTDGTRSVAAGRYGQAMTRADHRPYLRAVRAAIESKEIPVKTVVTDAGAIREGLLHLDPQATAAAFPEAAEVVLRWTEEHGWSYAAFYPPHSGLGTSWTHLGFGVLPTPDEVANWIGTVLINPALIVSNEDDPYRSAGDNDEDLEARIAAYGSKSATA